MVLEQLCQALDVGTRAYMESRFGHDFSQVRVHTDAQAAESARAVDLTAADIIVSVGRGIKEAENIPIVQKLADALGAELAASRPICDNGWLPMERQVGSSGQTVAPKMYVAVGISGAIISRMISWFGFVVITIYYGVVYERINGAAY